MGMTESGRNRTSSVDQVGGHAQDTHPAGAAMLSFAWQLSPGLAPRQRRDPSGCHRSVRVVVMTWNNGKEHVVMICLAGGTGTGTERMWATIEAMQW